MFEPTAHPRSRKATWRQQVRLLLISFLSEGLSPAAISLGLAVGVTLGLFPIPGFSSLVCILIAHIFRLNHSLVQGANWAATVLAVLLILPFLRLAEWVLRVDPLSLDDLAPRGVWRWSDAAGELWQALLHAAFGWLLCAPFIVAGAYGLTRLAIRALRGKPDLPLPPDPLPS